MLAHLWLDILLLLRNGWQLVSVLCGAVTMVILLRFGLPASNDDTLLLPAFILGILVISLLNVTQSAFWEDAREGRIPHWQGGRLTTEWVVASRFIAYTLCVGLPVIALFSLVMRVGEGEVSAAFVRHRILVLFLVSASVNAGGLLCSAVGICFRHSAMTVYLLILPFIFSVTIFAAPSLRAISSADFTLLLAVTLFFVPLACFATARILRLYAP